MIFKSKFAAVGAALLGAATVAAAVAAPAWAADRRVTLVNNTGVTMVRFYASNTDRSGWEEDILGSDVLRSGSSVRINVDDGSGSCHFDFKAVFQDGDVLTRSDVNVCTTSTYTYN